MKKLVIAFSGLVIVAGIQVFSVSAQGNHAIHVEKEIMTGDVIHITYEIEPVENVRFFNVILEPVLGGQKINVAEAYGNIGHRQQPGRNEIVWYVKKDFSGDISKLDIRVYAFAENEPRALAKVVSVSNNATVPCEVAFANNSQYADQVEWDFGDVESGALNHSSLENPTHTYTKSGIYTTRLAVNTGILCPKDWQVPSDNDWNNLASYLTNNGYGYQGSGNDIAKSIAAKTNWAPYSLAGTPGNDLTSNNSSDFSALPGGYRHMNGSFYDPGFGANWWSATNYLSSYAYYWSVYYNNNTLNRLNAQRTHGASVRCIRD